MMLTELCQELKNWFCDTDKDIYSGTFEIKDGMLSLPFLQDGQFFRITGSVFNDGVHQYSEFKESDTMQDEKFVGTIWAMRIPASVVALAEEIESWVVKNGEAVTSPYQSESWGGYSYSLKSGGAESGAVSWMSVFGSRLNRWRKL